MRNNDQPQMEQYLSTTYIDNPEEGGEYERPFKLFIPPNIQMVQMAHPHTLTTPIHIDHTHTI